MSGTVAGWVDDFRGDPALVEHLRSGGNVVLVGRYSSPSRLGYEMAAADLEDCVLAFLRVTGADLRSVLPPRKALVEMLRAAPSEVSFDHGNGKRFTNRFVTLDFSTSHQVVFLLSAGSGKKLDASLEQPAVRRLAELVAATGARLAFGKRLDRITRTAWGFAPVMLVLEANGGFIGDSRRVAPARGLDSVMIFFEAQQGQTYAEEIVPQTRNGMRGRTDPELKDGRCRIGVGFMPPPGFVRLRFREGTGVGRPHLYLDTPDVLPSDDLVAVGLPEVFDSDGRHVDQVANVRWALSKLGQPDWPAVRVAKGLIERKYSTAKLRAMNADASRTFQLDQRYSFKMLLRSLIANLDVYEKGVWSMDLGVDGFGPVEIGNCFPLDGRWASADDFKRIRRWHESEPRLMRSTAKFTFIGFPASINGAAVKLAKCKNLNQPAGYFGVLDAGDRTKRVAGAVRVPHSVLSELVVNLVVAAGDGFDVPAPEHEQDLEAAATIAGLRRKLSELRARSREIEAAVLERSPSGEFVLSGALRRTLSDEYDDLAVNLIPAAELAVSSADAVVQVPVQGARVPGVGDVLPLTMSVQDPSAMAYRALLRAGLRDLSVVTESYTDLGLAGRRLTLSGRLMIDVGDEQVSVSASVEWVDGDASLIAERVQSIVDQMAAGVPYWQTVGSWKRQLLPAVNVALGWPGGTRLTSCRDPRITRLTVAATVTDVDASPEELAERFGEPPQLFDRLRSLYGVASTGSGKWCQANTSVLPLMLDTAAVGGGLVRYTDVIPAVAVSRQALSAAIGSLGSSVVFEVEPNVGYRLVARCRCAPERPHLGVMRIKEPVGLVCRFCGRDQAGIVWPLDVYAQFFAEPVATSRRDDVLDAGEARSVEVRCWAVQNGLMDAARGGVLPNIVIDGWNEAHPTRLYARPVPEAATAKEVREWSAAQLPLSTGGGKLSNAAIDAWNEAHPERRYLGRRRPGVTVPTGPEIRFWARQNHLLEVTRHGSVSAAVLERWNAAHPDRQVRVPSVAGPAAPTAAELRRWAEGNGIVVSSRRGTLPNEVIFAWDRVHPARTYKGRRPTVGHPDDPPTPAEVRRWLLTQPGSARGTGRLSRSAIAAWNAAHPARPYGATM